MSVVAVPDATRDLSDRLGTASETAERAEATYRCKRAEEQAARRQVDEGPDLERCRRLLGDHEHLARLQQEFDQLNRDAQRAETDAEGAQETHEVAKGRVDTAFEALDRARSVKRAEGLIAQLREGEQCPVCGQVVVELPEHDLDAEMDQLEMAHNEARETLDAADESLRTADKIAARASFERDENARQREELEGRLSDEPGGEALSIAISTARSSGGCST